MGKTTELIRDLQSIHRLSQTDIGERTGIPQPRISRWASGKSPVGADDALKLAALAAELNKALPPGKRQRLKT